MKVLIVHDYGTRHGGAELVSLALREGLRRRGHDALLFTSRARPLPLPIEADATCHGSMGPGRRLLQVANPSALIRLRALLRDYRPDVVHVRMFMTQLSPLILPLVRSYPSLLHVVNYDLICPLNTKLLPDGAPCDQPAGFACYRSGCLSLAGLARAAAQQAMWRRWADAFDVIVANSHRVREQLTLAGIPVAHTIWNGVPVCAPRPPLGDPPSVGFAGRLFAKKGLDVLLEAMRLVVAELPTARLLIAGDGPERAGLEALAKRLELTSHTVWLGHLSRDAMERAFAEVWVQAVPSRWEEPFGLVAAEAMMRGTAVVASRGGGLGEQVVDGATGALVPVGDAGALAGALVRILRCRATAEAWGEAARRHAKTHFSEAQVVDQFVALYQRLLTTRDGARPTG